jgi:hypothetical protein
MCENQNASRGKAEGFCEPQRPRKPFLITIDTEGDNQWRATRDITCANARFLPRFQFLCESFGFKPTYLTNYEMAQDPAFIEFGRDVICRGVAEVGMHLHAWHSPPSHPLTSDDYRAQPYLIEYPDDVLREKVRYMTALLEDTFESSIISHRAGRWAFDHRYACALADLGYQADCSVTPSVSWRRSRGASRGGTDYRAFPDKPYFLDLRDIRLSGKSRVLEVPMSVFPRRLKHDRAPMSWISDDKYTQKALSILNPIDWLRPNGRNGKHMIALGKWLWHADYPYAQFMLHSSELMPGGSPRFPTPSSIDYLYGDLESLFASMHDMYAGHTLAEFRLLNA